MWVEARKPFEKLFNKFYKKIKWNGDVMSNDSLGDRIKTYEDSYRIKLPIRMPR
jgi:hypothetical protein